ncbi:helix-turn-helix domain-containing protein [Nocardioides sp. AE5]|uniref:helix-turn-helix transcriptional regulator n=1 Tax=Nocardioides sp. AE5 TaxID=2962573 RepID=UPI0028810DFE|nr:helix-turn-helix domain-containing protein [Nocardioides sp. AE5]MDT0200894.1 helix-turn-helix domain-containing protein [Nocardioides sp. AE5]
MKNNLRSPGRLGPRTGASRRPLSTSRQALLDRLRIQSEPTTLAALVKLSGLHPNTVREHLDALVSAGLVRREQEPPSGRGRPPWLYQAVDEEATNEYAVLASALAGALARSSDDPHAAGAEAGRAWGSRLARDRGASPTSPEAARTMVLRLLDEMGFAPEPTPGDEDRIRLTRCPLLEAAHRHPEVVCGVHLGIIDGAYAEQGVVAAGTELLPFAEPGACRLTLPMPQAMVPGPGTETR